MNPHIAFLVFGLAFASIAYAYSPAELSERAMERSAVDAVIWGMPAVNAELMFQAAKDNGADFNQVVYWSRPISWKNQTLTPNPDTIYLMPLYNTQEAGPMVLEIPPAETGENASSITGSIDEAWQTALEDVGPAGVDKGKGGKYLILPPGYKGAIPDGYVAVLKSKTYTGFALLRSNFKSGADADIARAVAYGKRVKFYPLSQADRPPETKYVDAVDVLFDSTIPYDTRFFDALNRFVQREPWLERDKVMIDKLKAIGIEKGKPFQPDADAQRILGDAAREAHAELDLKYLAAFTPPFNEGTHWALPASPDFSKGIMSDYADPNAYPVEDRGVSYSMAFFSAKHIGTGQYYLMTVVDKDGNPFNGSSTYRLNVPANAPVKLYWSATAYDRETHALIRNLPRASRASNSTGQHHRLHPRQYLRRWARHHRLLEYFVSRAAGRVEDRSGCNRGRDRQDHADQGPRAHACCFRSAGQLDHHGPVELLQ
jgi:hypothetical protein